MPTHGERVLIHCERVPFHGELVPVTGLINTELVRVWSVITASLSDSNGTASEENCIVHDCFVVDASSEANSLFARARIILLTSFSLCDISSCIALVNVDYFPI